MGSPVWKYSIDISTCQCWNSKAAHDSVGKEQLEAPCFIFSMNLPCGRSSLTDFNLYLLDVISHNCEHNSFR